ncbi:unnamed protein product [Rotaria socialis]|uniref:Uncharacterized protein n=1 Tax=Rotaria socialis TaxID=392032 RepID=A0A817U3K4_9BILA|nr:unnamed protein product [Rotaria socialis]
MPVRELYSFFIIILGKFADFGKAHNLTSAVINQINELRSEEEFSKLTGQITEFCVENNIGLSIKVKERTISTRFLNCSVTSKKGQCEKISEFCFYPIIDSILVEMNRGMTVQF